MSEKRVNKKNRETKIEPVDIHSYSARREAGLLWYNGTFIRDATIWTKTPKEKEAIRRIKRTFPKGFLSKWPHTKKSIPCYGKLIIQINGSNKTLSIECGQSDIPAIVSKYNTNGNVKWYKWNGKQYLANQFPYYYW